MGKEYQQLVTLARISCKLFLFNSEIDILQNATFVTHYARVGQLFSKIYLVTIKYCFTNNNAIFNFVLMFLSVCSKAIKKEKFKEEKEVPKPKKSPLPISIDTDDTIDSATPWLSAGKRSVSANGTNNNKSQSDEEHGATLIVCPLSVLSNWTVSV